MNKIIVRILTGKITRDKANNTLNVDDTTIRLKIFLAGGDITPEKYDEFIEMIIPETAVSNDTTTTTTTA